MYMTVYHVIACDSTEYHTAYHISLVTVYQMSLVTVCHMSLVLHVTVNDCISYVKCDICIHYVCRQFGCLPAMYTLPICCEFHILILLFFKLFN